LTGKYYYPTSEFSWSDGLSNACIDQLLDIGPCGINSWDGQDGSDINQRISRFVLLEGYSGVLTSA